MGALYLSLYFIGGLTLSGLITVYGLKKLFKSLQDLELIKK